MATKILLPEDWIPKHWYTLIPDMSGALKDYEYPEGKNSRGS